METQLCADVEVDDGATLKTHYIAIDLNPTTKQKFDHDQSREETHDDDNVKLSTAIVGDKDWRHLEKHERKTVRMASSDHDKQGDNVRWTLDDDGVELVDRECDYDNKLLSPDGDKICFNKLHQRNYIYSDWIVAVISSRSLKMFEKDVTVTF